MYNKEELDGWAQKALPILKENGYLNQKVSIGRNNWLMPLIMFVVGVMFCGVLLYAIDEGAFKSTFNQEIEPNVNINNSYSFDPKTENEYEFSANHTIINNVIIPSDLCGCSDGS